jgi:hypothetical protein
MLQLVEVYAAVLKTLYSDDIYSLSMDNRYNFSCHLNIGFETGTGAAIMNEANVSFYLSSNKQNLFTEDRVTSPST